MIATVGLATGSRTSPTSSPAASSSGSRWRGPWSAGRGSSSPTSRPATSTPGRAPRCSSCCGRSVDEHGQTVVMVTHDPVAAAYTDRVVFLADGRVVDELRAPGPRAGAGDHGPDDRGHRGRLSGMIKAALKSLLGRKVRLLMSTFAIVLGVAFVGGSLIFSDTLGRSFTALFASTVGDVVVRPGATSRRTAARPRPSASRRRWSSSSRTTSRTPPGSTATSAPSASTSSTRTTRSSAARAAGDRGQLLRRPGRPRAHRAHARSRAHEPHGPDEVVFDAKTAERAGLLPSASRCTSSPRRDAGA